MSDTVEIAITSAALHAIARGGALFFSVGRISHFAAVCLATPAFSAVGNAFLLHSVLGLPFDQVWIN